ncbi:hypothetical protein LWI28_022878 [Acer negundo]|uniref:Uncharacterized protein n=1 Tax=Acer negundo TaxID=4023 RepID=A0AAD5INH3_ACENE|nr:hypothetical protein LWI28_022878 [Acer negundo]
MAEHEFDSEGHEEDVGYDRSHRVVIICRIHLLPCYVTMKLLESTRYFLYRSGIEIIRCYLTRSSSVALDLCCPKPKRKTLADAQRELVCLAYEKKTSKSPSSSRKDFPSVSSTVAPSVVLAPQMGSFPQSTLFGQITPFGQPTSFG